LIRVKYIQDATCIVMARCAVCGESTLLPDKRSPILQS